MVIKHNQIDTRTTMKNQDRSAALGRPSMKLLGGGGGGEASTSMRSTNPRPLFCLGSSDIELFGLRGRFLAHNSTILET